jgi:hypothetical protein
LQIYPVELALFQVFKTNEDLLLVVEGLDDHTHEKVQEKQVGDDVHEN